MQQKDGDAVAEQTNHGDGENEAALHLGRLAETPYALDEDHGRDDQKEHRVEHRRQDFKPE